MLVSAVQQCESVIIIYIYPIPPEPPVSHPSRSSLGFLCYLATSHYFTHDSVYISMLLSQFILHSTFLVVSTNRGCYKSLCKTKSKESRANQFSSVIQSCSTLCDSKDSSTPASLPITDSRSLLKLLSIKSMMPSNHLILCCPLLLQPSIFPSIRVFSKESVLFIRWPKYWNFSLRDQSFQWISRTDLL